MGRFETGRRSVKRVACELESQPVEVDIVLGVREEPAEELPRSAGRVGSKLSSRGLIRRRAEGMFHVVGSRALATTLVLIVMRPIRKWVYKLKRPGYSVVPRVSWFGPRSGLKRGTGHGCNGRRGRRASRRDNDSLPPTLAVARGVVLGRLSDHGARGGRLSRPADEPRIVGDGHGYAAHAHHAAAVGRLLRWWPAEHPVQERA